jgi:hypothetical protein
MHTIAVLPSIRTVSNVIVPFIKYIAPPICQHKIES